MQGHELFSLKNKHFTLRKSFHAEDPKGQDLFEVKGHFTGQSGHPAAMPSSSASSPPSPLLFIPSTLKPKPLSNLATLLGVRLEEHEEEEQYYTVRNIHVARSVIRKRDMVIEKSVPILTELLSSAFLAFDLHLQERLQWCRRRT